MRVYTRKTGRRTGAAVTTGTTMSEIQTTHPTFNITIRVDTEPLAAALVALVDRFLRKDEA